MIGSLLMSLLQERFCIALQCQEAANVAHRDAPGKEDAGQPGPDKGQVLLGTPSNAVVDQVVSNKSGNSSREDAEAKATIGSITEPPQDHRQEYQGQGQLPVTLKLNFSTGLIDANKESHTLHDVGPFSRKRFAQLVVQAWVEEAYRYRSGAADSGNPPGRGHEH